MTATSLEGILLSSAGIVIILTVGVLALIVLYKILRNQIDISDLLSSSGEASLSRFQFLIFTFTIGFSYIMVVLYQFATHLGAEKVVLPDATGAVGLLGISAGGYVLGKGIQTAGDTATTNAQIAANAPGASPPPVPGPAPAPPAA